MRSYPSHASLKRRSVNKKTNDYEHRDKSLRPYLKPARNSVSSPTMIMKTCPPYQIVTNMDDLHRIVLSFHAEIREQIPVLYILRMERRTDKSSAFRYQTMVPGCTMGNNTNNMRDDRPNCMLRVSSNVRPARLDTTERDPVGTELPEHQSTMRCLNDVHLAQKEDIILLALKKLMKNETMSGTKFPEDLQYFAKKCYH